jgi:hypothetical protein
MRFSRPFGLVALAATVPAFAHHSDAALDMDRVMMIEGTVTEYTMRNPHTYFVVQVENDDGSTADWNVQMASMITIMRRGWTRDTLKVGDQVVVGLRPARDGRPYGLLSSVERDGESVVAPFDGEDTRAAAPAAQARADSIDGVWLIDRTRLPDDYPGGLDQLMEARLNLTAKGRDMKAAFSQNDADNPELSCLTKPVPGGIVYARLYPMQIETRTDQNVIMIRSQYFDQERTVYMDGRAHPPASERTHEGHSIGRWDGDTLVVDTTNFADDRSPYQNGIPSGAQKHVVERYRLLDGGTHLRVEFTLEDPEYIVGSMSESYDLRYSPQLQMTPFNCDPESTRRYLPTRQ